jgi:hypothetical protein
VNGKDLLKMLAATAVGIAKSGAIPGGAAVVTGVEMLTHRDDDPTNDTEEVTKAVILIASGGEEIFTTASGKDLVNNEVLQMLGARIADDIELAKQVIKREVALAKQLKATQA